MKDRIVIIDGNSLINRAFYAMQRPMITKEGVYTQGIYGFINMLNKIKDDYAPEYLAVAFDLKAPTFRHLEYDQYKAGRKKMPPELVMQIPLLKDVLHAMNIETLELEGYEGDDIIGTLAKEGEKAGLKPLIITGDKDALQLATDLTQVLITKKGISDFELFDHDKMIEKYGLTPSQFIDLKGLMGDSSDNIPGIPGVGEKTGISLLKQFGSIENLLDNYQSITKEGLRKKVEENSQLAILSKSLATINTSVPIEIDFERLKVEEPDYPKLIELYKKLEFNSFLRKLSVPAGTVISEADKNKTINKELENFNTVDFSNIQKNIISTDDDLIILNKINIPKPWFIKTFGSFSHVKKPQIEGIALINHDTAIFIDTTKVNTDQAVNALNNLNLSVWGHEIKDDIYSLMFYGFNKFSIEYDTAIAEYVLDVSKNKYDIRALAMEKLQLNIESQDIYFENKGQLDMFSNPAETYLDYCILIAEAASKIKEKQVSDIKAQQLEKVLYDVEIPLIEVLASMEVWGIKTDADMLEEFGREIREKIQVLELEIYDYAGEKFNINSPKQLGEILFEKLLLPAGKKGKTGYSTSAEVLEKIKGKHPIVEAVLRYRNLSKLNSTYVEGMKPLICSDGKIRAHFQQTVTATGRISCTEPNLQNIPIRQELGRNLRRVFRSTDDNHKLIGADYSQIELRVLAHLSQDEGLIEAFNTGQDIHRLTASRVLGIDPEKVTVTDRSKAKAVNFGVIYGMSGFGLSEELKISRKEAETYIDEYFKKHEKVKSYMDLQKEMCKKKGYSETILGRKRRINEIHAGAYMVRQLGERLAMNSPIQGSAADIIKLAMIKVYNGLKENHLKSKLILQIHDELIIDCPKEELEIAEKILKENMEGAMDLSVKLEAEVNSGDTWLDLK